MYPPKYVLCTQRVDIHSTHRRIFAARHKEVTPSRVSQRCAVDRGFSKCYQLLARPRRTDRFVYSIHVCTAMQINSRLDDLLKRTAQL